MLHIAKVSRVATLTQWATRPLVVAIATIERVGRVATQRRALRLLDERQLKDIGLSRADALHEAGRPFWDLPPHTLVEGAAGVSRPSRQACPYPGNRAVA